MNCLWLARAMPYPLTSGDRIYSAKLAASLANAGAEVVFVGLSANGVPKSVPGIVWDAVPGRQRSQTTAVLSPLPLVAAMNATRTYRSHAAALVGSQQWDAIMIDHYGSGWLHPIVMSATNRPVRVFISHNHEASVTRGQWRDTSQSMLVRAYMWQNWLKTIRLERAVARNSDLITTITDVDAERFAWDVQNVPMMPLTPGYDGVRLPSRSITFDTPRSIILFGSYLWSAKQSSLILFLDQADPVMGRAGITIDVVGDMDKRLRRSLSTKYRAARFHGYVDDAAPYLARARMAVIAEPIGGGFKLKLLEYIFNRVPVASLAVCTHGLSEHVRTHMLLADDVPSLVAKVVAEVDRVDRLNARHEGAYNAAISLFDWSHRGRALLNAIREIRSGRHRNLKLEWPHQT
jgi:glycosyltransferase involved in cell wall biosynthesis